MCHVLIIEDDWLIADHICQLVERAGATSVDMADTEDDAVAQALDHRPDVIISDVDLKAGGNGPDAVQRIVVTLGEIPVMFVTGEPRSFRSRSSATQVLHKPVNDLTLVAAFRAIAPLQ